MSIIQRTRRRRQPRHAALLDKGNPLTRNIIFAGNWGVGGPYPHDASGNIDGIGLITAWPSVQHTSAYGGARGAGFVGSNGLSLGTRPSWDSLQAEMTIACYYELGTTIPADGLTGGHGYVLCARDSDTLGRPFTLDMTYYSPADQGVRFYVDGGNNSIAVEGLNPVAYDRKMAIGTYRADSTGVSEILLYINGALKATGGGAETTIPVGTSRVTVGVRDYVTYEDNFTGTIFFLAIWNRCLTSQEVRSISVNPWQLWEPYVRRAYISVGAVLNSYTLTATKGAYTETGNAAPLLRGGRIISATGSYIESGVAAGLRKASILPSAAGSYADTGVVAGLRKTSILPSAAGSYAETGVAAGLRKASILPSAAGSYAETGNAAALLRGGRVAADVGAYIETGIAAALRKTSILPSAAGAYAETGNAAALLRGGLITASAGAYTETGVAAALRKTSILPSAAGAYAETGNAAGLNKGFYVAGGPGAYTETGNDAALRKASILPSVAGSYAETGNDAALRKTSILPASAGAFIETGVAAALLLGHGMPAGTGVFTITAAAAGLLAVRRLSASAGAYAETGVTAGLRKTSILSAAAGSFLITGSAASLLYATPGHYMLGAGIGVFNISGVSVPLVATRILTAAQGSFVDTGNDATLAFARKLAAAHGQFNLTGNSSGLRKTSILSAAAGAYVETGHSAALLRLYSMLAGGGAFNLTGDDAALLRGYRLTAGRGLFNETGRAASLLYHAISEFSLLAATGQFHVTPGAAQLLYSASGRHLPRDLLQLYVMPAEPTLLFARRVIEQITAFVPGGGSVTPANVPDAPLNVVATAGNGQAIVTFNSPLSNGGAVIINYVVTSNPAGGVDNSSGPTSHTHIVTGLTNGMAYTFTAVAINRVGMSAASVASSPVTPHAPIMVSGAISGDVLAGVTIVASGVGATTTESDGTWSITVPLGWTGTITASRGGYTFAPSSSPFTNVQSSSTGNGFVATAIPTYTVSGTISGDVLSGVTITVSGVGTTTTANDGTWSVTALQGWSGTITPSRTGYTFTPSSTPISDVQANAPGNDFVAAALPTYALSGMITGDVVAGVTIAVSGGVTGTTTAGDGTYSVTVPQGWSGTITPQYNTANFNPASITWSSVSASHTGQDFISTNAPAPGGDPEADFLRRRSGIGVVRWRKFDSSADLGVEWPLTGKPAPVGIERADSFHGLRRQVPEFDPTVKVSGSGSMKFTVWGNPPTGYNGQFYEDIAGSFWMNYSDDYSVKFGANSKHYVQMRFRLSQSMIDQYFDSASSGGFKFFDIVPGDSAVNTYWTSVGQKLVIQTFEHSKLVIPYMYNPDTGETWNLYESLANGDIALENALACFFSAQYAALVAAGKNPYDVPGCFQVGANEWMTVEVEVTKGPVINNPRVPGGSNKVFAHSRVRMWWAHENEPPVLTTDYNENMFANYRELGANPEPVDGTEITVSEIPESAKLFVFPFFTARYSYHPHQDGTVHCDQIIVSRDPIPFPGGYQIGGANPTLQAALSANKLVDLGPWATTTTNPSDGARWWEYGGMRYDAKRHRLVVSGGGHASTNFDPLSCFDLTTLTWANEYAATPNASMVSSNFDLTRAAWLSGPSGPYPRPVARHTEGSWGIRDDEIFLLGGVEGNQDFVDDSSWTSFGGSTQHRTNVDRPRIARYNSGSRTWTWDIATGLEGWGACCLDPTSRRFLQANAALSSGGVGGFWSYDPDTPTVPQTCFLNGLADLTNWTIDGGIPDTSTHLSVNGQLVHCTLDDKFYFFSGITVLRLAYNRSVPSASTVTRMHLTGGGAPADYDTGMDWDVRRNKFIGGFRYGQARIFDPVANSGHGQWAIVNMTGANGTEACVLSNTVACDPINDCTFFINTMNGHLMAYRPPN